MKEKSMTTNEIGLAFSYTLIIFIGTLGGIGDAWISYWSKSNSIFWMIAACSAHLTSVIIFGLLLRWDIRTVTSACVISSVVHFLVVIIYDAVIFKEIPTRTEWIGIFFATIGLIILEIGRDNSNADDHKFELSKITRNGR